MTNSADRQKSKTGSVNKYTWIPVALVLIPALATLGNLSWTTSILLGAPLAMISLFISNRCGIYLQICPARKSADVANHSDASCRRASAELALDAHRGTVFARACIHSPVARDRQTIRSRSLDRLFDGLFVLCVFRGISLCCDGAGRGARGRNAGDGRPACWPATRNYGRCVRRSIRISCLIV